MYPCHAAALAIVAAGLISAGAVAAAAEAPVGHEEKRELAGRPPLSIAFYHVEIEYTGTRLTESRRLSLNTAEQWKTTYRAKTRRPVVLRAFCWGSHSRLLPAQLRNSAGACSKIRREALALLKGARRFKFAKEFRGAREAYAMGRNVRSTHLISLRGTVTEGQVRISSWPHAVVRVGNQGRRVRVTCEPDTAVILRKQTIPQEGLVVRLRTGHPNPGRTSGIVTRRTSLGGLQLTSDVEGGAATRISGYDESSERIRCPGIDGSPDTFMFGDQRTNVPFTWLPLDRGLDRVDRDASQDLPAFPGIFSPGPRAKFLPLERLLAFSRPRGKLGKPFKVRREGRVDRPLPAGASGPKTTIQTHRWTIRFRPCKNPRDRQTC